MSHWNFDPSLAVTNTSDDLLATDELISLREAASIVGLSPASLRRYVLQGKLQALKIGRNWVTTMAAVEQYMSRREASKAPKNRRKPR
jgi:excisionase family DNA binding protein